MNFYRELEMKRPIDIQLNTVQTNRIQNLSDAWKLACDPANHGKHLKWHENPPEKESRPTSIPGIIQEALPDYHGVAWYWTTFRTMLREDPASVYTLKFHEVDYFAEIWLNGVLLGSHEGAEFSFELNVQNALKFDGENLLVVRVINPIEEPIDGFVLGDTAHGVRGILCQLVSLRSASQIRFHGYVQNARTL
jgi:beta-galactosidase/beta-glucuronidase